MDVLIEKNEPLTISERVFIGDNNHSFSHPEVPIMQQPNKVGTPVYVGSGPWVGAGASLLPGTRLGRNNVVGKLSVVKGEFPDHAVIGPVPAKLLFVKSILDRLRSRVRFRMKTPPLPTTMAQSRQTCS